MAYDLNAIPDVEEGTGYDLSQIPDVGQEDSTSLYDRISGIGKVGALGVVKAGTTLARGLNQFGEYANKKLDETFPETMGTINSMLPNMGAYALPSDAEYAQTSKDIEQEIADTTEKLAPKEGVGRYAYLAAQGLAELAPKLTMGPAGFATAAGAEGGLDRFYRETDAGRPASETIPYALAGGGADAVAGYLMPKAIGSVLSGTGQTIGKLAKELGIFAGFGVSQTALESALRKYLLGDETALDDLPQQLKDAVITAPFMMAGLKGGQALAGGAKSLYGKLKPKKATNDLDSKINELQKTEAPIIPPESKGIETQTPPRVEPVKLENGQEVPNAFIAPEPLTPTEPTPSTWLKNVRNPETGLLQAEKSLVGEAQQKLAESKVATQEKLGAAKESSPTTQKGLVDSPVFEIPTEQIATRPELMQFKRSDNISSGTNKADELSGKWDDNKAGNLLLWEPLDPQKYGLAPGQRYIVANGHHRLEFGERNGRRGFNTQIIKEADGISAETAKILAAEINIADGKGTVYDQVKLLRNSRAAYGEDAALEAGDRLGSKGRQASTIAFEAENSLIDAFVNEVVSPKQAEAIAKAAPLDDGAQRAGIAEVVKDKNADPLALSILVRGVKDRIRSIQGEQGTLIPSDDSAMVEARDIAALIKQKQSEVRSQKGAIAGAAASPDLANKSGVVSVTNAEAARAKVEELKSQQESLKRAHTDPAQMDQLRTELRSKGRQPSLFDKKGDRGAFISPLGEAIEAGKKAIDRFGKDREINKQIEQGLKDGSILTPDEQLPRFEKMLRGDVSKRDLPDTARKFAGAYHKWTTFVRTAAGRSPEVRKWYNASKEELKITHVTESKLLGKLQPYIDLVDSARVDEFLRIQRRRASEGKSINESDANLKALKFSSEEVSAIRAVRDTLDSALEQYKSVQLQTADGKKSLESLNSEIESLRAAKYVPFGRFGDWRVDAIKNGEPAVFFEESRQAALKRAGMLKSEGYESKVTERVLPKDVPYRLPNELTEPGGFKKHLIEAKLTKGEAENLKKSIGEYVVNLAKYSGFKLTSKSRAEAFETLKNSKQAKTYEWLTKVDSDFHSPTHGVVRGIRNFMYNYYLRLNPGSALVNLTQPFTVTYPLLSKEVSWSGAKTAAAYKDVGKYLVTGKTGDVALDSMITRARKEGIIGDNIHRDWLEMARTGKGKSLISKLVPDMFAGAEYINRLHAFAAGYKAFKSKGMEGDALYNRVTDFVDQSQFQYGKINSPLMARGGFAAPMTFRLWLGNYLSLLGKSMHQGDYGVATRLLGTMAVLGGGAGMPFVKDVLNILESQDKDPRKWIRDKLGKSVDDYFSYGLAAAIPEQYRPNVTGKVGVGEMVQDVDKGNALATVGRAVLGATADPILRSQKAVGFAMDGNLGRAVETMLPEGLPKGISKLYRATRIDPQTGEEAGLRNAKGEPIMTNLDGSQQKLTLAEKIMLPISLQPSRLSDAYKRQHSEYLATERDKNTAEYYNSRMADALYNNDGELFDQLAQEAVSKGFKPSSESIKSQFTKKLIGAELPRLKNANKRVKPELLDIYESR